MAITSLPAADYNSDLRRTQRNTANDPFASVAVTRSAICCLLPNPYFLLSCPELFLEEAAQTYILKTATNPTPHTQSDSPPPSPPSSPSTAPLKASPSAPPSETHPLADELSTPEWDALSITPPRRRPLTIFSRRLESAIDSGWAGFCRFPQGRRRPKSRPRKSWVSPLLP